jgi:PAT family beta-lactamase induction signal transducer AmpG
MLISGAFALILADQIGFGNTYFFMAAFMGLFIFSTMGGPEPEDSKTAPKSIQDAFAGALKDFFLRDKALLFLILVVLYKLTDAFAGTLTTAFLIRGTGFSLTDVGLVNKAFGLTATIAGAFLGGSIMTRLRLFYALLIFGFLQGISNLAFMGLALVGKNYYAMIGAVGFENLTGGMGTAAFVAFLMALCNQRYSATQYALLSSLAGLGRVFVGPPSGFIVESVGWPIFFFLTSLVAIPGLLLLFYMKKEVNGLDLRAENRPDSG